MQPIAPRPRRKGMWTRSARVLAASLLATLALSGCSDDDGDDTADRKSTRLNSSHSQISYAVFCLKKKMPHGDDVSRTDEEVRLAKLDAVLALLRTPGRAQHHQHGVAVDFQLRALMCAMRVFNVYL